MAASLAPRQDTGSGCPRTKISH